MKAPFPYFEDRRAGLGGVENYVEPFFGSGAVFPQSAA